MPAIFNRKPTTYRSGQGLLETIVAMGLLITGVVSLLVVVVSSSVSRSLAETQTAATNLAREGVEVVRNMRDTNWIAGNAFDAGMVGAGFDYTFIAKFDATANAWSLISVPPSSPLGNDLTKLYQYAAGGNMGLFVEDTTPPPGTVESVYRRVVVADPICANGTIVTSGSDCSSNGGKVGVRVAATVQWNERGRTHQATVEDRLYDWR